MIITLSKKEYRTTIQIGIINNKSISTIVGRRYKYGSHFFFMVCDILPLLFFFIISLTLANSPIPSFLISGCTIPSCSLSRLYLNAPSQISCVADSISAAAAVSPSIYSCNCSSNCLINSSEVGSPVNSLIA